MKDNIKQQIDATNSHVHARLEHFLIVQAYLKYPKVIGHTMYFFLDW